MEKDPKIVDSLYWKYQGLLESFFNFETSSPLMQNPELKTEAFAHIAKKIYLMGYLDARKDYDPRLIEVEDPSVKKNTIEN